MFVFEIYVSSEKNCGNESALMMQSVLGERHEQQRSADASELQRLDSAQPPAPFLSYDLPIPVVTIPNFYSYSEYLMGPLYSILALYFLGS